MAHLGSFLGGNTFHGTSPDRYVADNEQLGEGEDTQQRSFVTFPPLGESFVTFPPLGDLGIEVKGGTGVVKAYAQTSGTVATAACQALTEGAGGALCDAAGAAVAWIQEKVLVAAQKWLLGETAYPFHDFMDWFTTNYGVDTGARTDSYGLRLAKALLAGYVPVYGSHHWKAVSRLTKSLDPGCGAECGTTTTAAEIAAARQGTNPAQKWKLYPPPIPGGIRYQAKGRWGIEYAGAGGKRTLHEGVIYRLKDLPREDAEKILAERTGADPEQVFREVVEAIHWAPNFNKLVTYGEKIRAMVPLIPLVSVREGQAQATPALQKVAEGQARATPALQKGARTVSQWPVVRVPTLVPTPTPKAAKVARPWYKNPWVWVSVGGGVLVLGTGGYLIYRKLRKR